MRICSQILSEIFQKIKVAARPTVFALALGLVIPAASAQQTPINNSPPPTIPGLSPNPAQPDSSEARMAEKMARQRNNERQKQIVDDSAHLLKLAQQLNADVSKSNKYTLSLPVVKEAAEIEKLAKTIKDKMKEGY